MDQSLGEWRPVVGYEGLYEVSSCGKIRSIDGVRSNGQTTHKFKGRELKLLGSPYLHVALSKSCVTTTRRVHVLVAEAFLPECPGVHGRKRGCYHIDHINNDKFDNRVSNLRWLGHVENTCRGSNALCNRLGSRHPNAKLHENDVKAIRASSMTAKEVASTYSISRDYVYNLRRREGWKHV